MGTLVLGFAPLAQAWSTRASRTESDVKELSIAIELYQKEWDKLPPPERYWMEVQPVGIWLRNSVEPGCDIWGRPFVYRVPGKHGAFDLYSLGEDGIDQGGAKDDISNWAGVNDGYHYKATWPLGRWSMVVGLVLGAGSLLLRRFFRWRVVLPLAGAVACLGVGLGSHLLKHPGVVHSRNGPLFVLSASVFCLGVVLLGVFLFHLRQNARLKLPAD